MPVAELLSEGVQLMFIGMGSVFMFLSVLVITMKLVAFLAHRFQPEPTSAKACRGATNEHFINQQEVIAVITAAISRYRTNH